MKLSLLKENFTKFLNSEDFSKVPEKKYKKETSEKYLSICCGAPPLNGQVDVDDSGIATGMCSGCKDGSEFVKEDTITEVEKTTDASNEKIAFNAKHNEMSAFLDLVDEMLQKVKNGEISTTKAYLQVSEEFNHLFNVSLAQQYGTTIPTHGQHLEETAKK